MKTDSRPSARRQKTRQQGQVLVLAGLALVLLVSAAGLALDYGLGVQRQRQTQTAADAVALAEAYQFQKNQTQATADNAGVVAASHNGAPTTSPNLTVEYLDGSGANLPTPIVPKAVVMVRVTITDQVATNFIRLVGFPWVNVKAVAKAKVTQSCALCIMSPNASPALDLSSGGGVNVTGDALAVNSSAANAISSSGAGTVTSPRTNVVGGAICTGCVPAPVTGAQPVPDPVGPFLLDPPALPQRPDAINSGATPMTIDPGVYNQIITSSSGSITLNPGVYVITGIMDNSSGGPIIGYGVTLYFECFSATPPGWRHCNSPGEAGGYMNVSANAGTHITAPTSGPYQGLALTYDKYNNSSITLTANGGALPTGTVYAPAANLIISSSGSATMNSLVVVNSVTLSSGGSLNLSFDPSQNMPAASRYRWPYLVQ